jgi:hypothetical protein
MLSYGLHDLKQLEHALFLGFIVYAPQTIFMIPRAPPSGL